MDPGSPVGERMARSVHQTAFLAPHARAVVRSPLSRILHGRIYLTIHGLSGPVVGAETHWSQHEGREPVAGFALLRGVLSRIDTLACLLM